jgi:hypothetical protein
VVVSLTARLQTAVSRCRDNQIFPQIHRQGLQIWGWKIQQFLAHPQWDTTNTQRLSSTNNRKWWLCHLPFQETECLWTGWCGDPFELNRNECINFRHPNLLNFMIKLRETIPWSWFACWESGELSCNCFCFVQQQANYKLHQNHNAWQTLGKI